MRGGDCYMVGHVITAGLTDRHRAVVWFGQAGHQTAYADRLCTGNNPKCVRTRPGRRAADHALLDAQAEQWQQRSPVQCLGSMAGFMRCADCDDVAGTLAGVSIEQMADDKAAEAVPDKMQHRRVDTLDKRGKFGGINTWRAPQTRITETQRPETTGIQAPLQWDHIKTRHPQAVYQYHRFRAQDRTTFVQRILLNSLNRMHDAFIRFE